MPFLRVSASYKSESYATAKPRENRPLLSTFRFDTARLLSFCPLQPLARISSVTWSHRSADVSNVCFEAMDVYWSDFIAGCFGGIGGTFVGHPIDTIKVRQQTHSDGFLSARRCFQLSLRNEGPTGLFKGMSSPLATAALVNATFFGVYGNTIKLMQKAFKEPSDAVPDYRTVAVAGMVAGTAQLVVNCPVELVKIKLQVSASNGGASRAYKGPIDCLISLYKVHGIRGWYKGLVPMFWRDGPSYGLYMALYEWINRHGKKYIDSSLGDALVTLIAGGVTGTVTWVSVLPIDVVKSRIQADCSTSPKYRGMIDCVRMSYREEGWQVFFRGFYAIAIRALIVNAVTFLVYETTLWHLTNKRTSQRVS